MYRYFCLFTQDTVCFREAGLNVPGLQKEDLQPVAAVSWCVFFFFHAAVLYLYKQYLTLIISGHTHFKTGTQADVKAATCVLIAISNGSEPRIKLLTFLLSAVLMPSCAY